MKKKIIWLDLPNPNDLGPDKAWMNIETFTSKEEAIKWARENICASIDDEGNINILSEGEDDFDNFDEEKEKQQEV